MLVLMDVTSHVNNSALLGGGHFQAGSLMHRNLSNRMFVPVQLVGASW